jgi:taurine transport system substrate-binding protein
MDKLLCALFATFGSLLFVVQAQNVVRVRYGYFPEARPVRVACARGWLDYTSGSTFYKVACYPQTSGNFASSRLDSGQLDIADLGSTPLAQALARGLEINVVYITDYKGDSQGIYVRPSEEDTGYAGIENPFDLENRTLGVPFGSTMHYQVLYLLDIFGLSGKVVLRDLSPMEIIQEWDEKLIDAAACWGAAREHVLRENDDTDQPPANTLVTAGVVGDWGRPTFGVVAANRQFMKLHAGFLERFVTVFAQLTDSFIDHLGEDDPNNVARWTPQKAGTSSFIPSLADSIMKPGEPRGNPSDAFINQQRRAMNLYKQQSTSEQLSCDYLMANGGASCGKPSLQHEAIQQTARFLMDQKVIHSMGQLENMGNETNCAFKHTLCGGDLFAGNILKTGNQFYGSSTFLSTLSSSGSVFPLNEIGRLSTGDSSCTAGRKVFYGSGTNSFGDGANAITGKSYSGKLL